MSSGSKVTYSRPAYQHMTGRWMIASPWHPDGTKKAKLYLWQRQCETSLTQSHNWVWQKVLSLKLQHSSKCRHDKVWPERHCGLPSGEALTHWASAHITQPEVNILWTIASAVAGRKDCRCTHSTQALSPQSRRAVRRIGERCRH